MKIGIRHPDPVVETSSLSSVEPPDVWYDLRIPEQVSSSRALLCSSAGRIETAQCKVLRALLFYTHLEFLVVMRYGA